MFKDCHSLLSLADDEKWNTENGTNKSYMNYCCLSLSSLHVFSKFDTSKVINMTNMFFHCSSLV